MFGRRLSPLAVIIGLTALGLAAPAQQRSPAPAPAPPTPPTPPTSPVVPDKLRSFVPITEHMLLKPRPENWINFRNGYRMWGYSSLSQINAGNVGELRLVWSRAMQDGP